MNRDRPACEFVLVTGASQGMGASHAERLARERAKVLAARVLDEQRTALWSIASSVSVSTSSIGILASPRPRRGSARPATSTSPGPARARRAAIETIPMRRMALNREISPDCSLTRLGRVGLNTGVDFLVDRGLNLTSS
jgi:NAD(P)-dependent dehydrogenase (short-subunit alcohol dehydrogenase family)